MGCFISCLRSSVSIEKSFDVTDQDNVLNNERFMNRISLIPQNDADLGVLPDVIDSRFQISGDSIACGAFGCIYPAKELGNASKVFAVKIEILIDNDYPQLKHESNMYIALEGGVGIPRSYTYQETPERGLLVMDMLGKSLQDLFFKCNGKFSTKTVLMCAEQMINRLQWLHEKNFIHRDLKPANFAIGYEGTSDENTIFILDFGLSKRWRNFITKDVRPFAQRYVGLIGTAMFAARSANEGWEQGRKEDLESLGYILLYFLSLLPWMPNNFPGLSNEAFFDKLNDLKNNLPLDKYDKKIPKEFIAYLTYARGLTFEQRPDYEYCKKLFRRRARKLNIKYPYDFSFDWNSKKL